MAIYPYRFSSDSSLKPKSSDKKSKEVKIMACKTKKSTSKKTGKKGGKKC